MYTQFFRLAQAPFSISPDPRYLFMSERHREALAHLLYGIDSGGGVVLLSGDIGTGKTTICRCLLEQVPANCNVAYIFNPKLTVRDLLLSICEEFHIAVAANASTKDYIDALNRYLLAAHADRRNNVLIIDEAQNLTADVLEQLRLLTNLETNERKLLQIILIGQPELRTMLALPELEQLAQRVIAHFHLTALSELETTGYVLHRLATAGLTTDSPFPRPLIKHIHHLTAGVPRRINLLCDRALLGAYARGTREINREIVDQAATELFIHHTTGSKRRRWQYAALGVLAGSMALGTTAWTMSDGALIQSVKKEWIAPMASAGGDVMKILSIAPADPAPETIVAATSAGVPTAAVTLEDADAAAGTGWKSESDALQQLAQSWDWSLTDGMPCAGENAGLRCHRSSGGIAELRQLNRPAVLTLYDDAGLAYHAILTSLSDSEATLRTGAVSRTIGVGELMRQFRGQFVTLWRAPGTFGHTVEMGDRGPEVDWIAAQLAALNGSSVPPQNQPFSQATLKQVRQFQQAQGLFVDGVVGPITLMHLNRVAGVAEPRLRIQATSGE